jgi:hypothetical protein
LAIKNFFFRCFNFNWVFFDFNRLRTLSNYTCNIRSCKDSGQTIFLLNKSIINYKTMTCMKLM